MIDSGATRLAHPSLALAAYLERLVRGRRVAVLGDVTLAFGERLVERGARLVHVYDPNPVRVAEVLAKTAGERPRQLTHAVLEGDLGVRDGAFDVVVIPDLTVFGEPTDALRKMRRLVGSTGVAVVASSNADAPRRLLDKPSQDKHSTTDYYALYDLVSLQFPVVRMLGQAPFVGYTLADFGATGELEVSVDTSLLETTEEPEIFIAIASERKVAIDPFVVVELALADVRKSMGASVGAATIDAAAANDERAKERAAAAAREAEQRAALEEQTARATNAAARVAELEEKIEKLREVEARAGDTHVRAERLTHQIRDLEEELRRQRDRATKLAKQLDDEKKARTKAEVELGLSRGPKDVPGAKEKIDQLTQEAAAVRSRAMELEGELAAAEIGINDLVSERADLRGRIAELEDQLAKEQAKAPDPSLLERLAKLEQAVEEARADKLAAEKRARADAEALAAVTAERDRLAETNAALEKRAADLALEREALATDMDALEGRLRERGQRIAGLEKDLQEGLRVGKELLAELEEARTAGAAPISGGDGSSSPAGSGGKTPRASTPGYASAAPAAAPELPNAMSVQLDILAARAARAEADLEAARWRISQLELSAAAAERDDVEPAAVAVELEQALLASQQEVATLRRAVGPEGGHVAPGVVEQAVLLHQVASQMAP